MNARLAVLLTLAGSLGAWDRNGTPVAAGPGSQLEAQAAYVGNALHVSYQLWGPTAIQIRVARIETATGHVLWDVPAVTDGSRQMGQRIAADRAGTLWAAFERRMPSASLDGNITLQRFGTAGELLLGPQGRRVHADTFSQIYSRLCPDLGGDGVFVCWQDYRSGAPDAYLVRVSADGNVTLDVPVCSIPALRRNPLVIPAQGGATVFWEGTESNDTLGVYANRLAGDRFLWGARGKLVLPYLLGALVSTTARSIFDNGPPYVASDSLGAYVFPALPVEGVQYIDTTGRRAFDVPLPYATPYSMTLGRDRSAVCCYSSYPRMSDPYQSVICTRIDSRGQRPWGSYREIWRSTFMDTQLQGPIPYCSITGDYGDGFVVAIGGWLTTRDNDIFVIHLDSSGQAIGEPIVVCDAPGGQTMPIVVQDSATRGYFVVWEDWRAGEDDCDIYATHLDSLLAVGVEEAPLPKEGRLLSLAPNPFARAALIEFSVPGTRHATLTVHDVTGRTVCTIADGVLRSGRHVVEWRGTDDSGLPVVPGIYFVHLSSSGRSATAKVVKVE